MSTIRGIAHLESNAARCPNAFRIRLIFLEFGDKDLDTFKATKCTEDRI